MIKRVNTCFNSVIVYIIREYAMWRVSACPRVRDTACTPCSVYYQYDSLVATKNIDVGWQPEAPAENI